MRGVLLILIVLFVGIDQMVYSQFDVIPLGTSQAITGLDYNSDSLFITSQYGFFGKTHDLGESITTMMSIGPVDYTILDFQIIGDDYYALAVQGSPYQHNYVLKSIDYGQSWIELYDTVGLFYTLTMADSDFGIMGGTFGGNAITDGNDASWSMDTLYSVLCASAAYDDSTMIVMSIGGYSYVTEDRGQTWNWGYCISERTMVVQFQSRDTIYSIAHGGPSGTPESYFSHSYDGGDHFTNIWIGYNNIEGEYEFSSRVFDMHFDSPDHGFLLGYIYDSLLTPVNQMVIFETDDYGETWNPHLTGFSEVAYAMEFVNDSIAFIGGDNGLLIKWNTNIPFADELSLEENHEQNQIQIYPNPANEILTVESDLPIEFVEIIDMSGKVVMRVNVEGKKSEKFFLSNFPDGIFTISVHSAEAVWIERFVKM